MACTGWWASWVFSSSVARTSGSEDVDDDEARPAICGDKEAPLA